MSFPVKPFALELPSNGGVSFVILGTSRSGKSSLLRYLLRTYLKKLPGVLFTMNPQAHVYEGLAEKMAVSTVYHPEILEEMHEMNRETANKFPYLVVFDDYTEPRMRTCPSLTRLLTIARNSGGHSCFLAQGRVMMSATGRASANYIIIFKQQTARQWKDIIEEYLIQYFPTNCSMREMIDICMKCTESHAFFVIDNINEEVFVSVLNPSQL